MKETQLGLIETRFVELIWDKEPISSTNLVKLCEMEFGWKKSTTYTVLKRVSEKGIIENNNGTVTSLISKEAYYATHSERVIDETYHGSLPAFIAAFTSKNTLSNEEAEEIIAMIQKYREE